MEHDDKPLPIDVYSTKIILLIFTYITQISTLASLAEKCHAYAKALHYKETEFLSSPSTCIEALIHINNQLQQPEAASGYDELRYHQRLRKTYFI